MQWWNDIMVYTYNTFPVPEFPTFDYQADHKSFNTGNGKAIE